MTFSSCGLAVSVPPSVYCRDPCSLPVNLLPFLPCFTSIPLISCSLSCILTSSPQITYLPLPCPVVTLAHFAPFLPLNFPSWDSPPSRSFFFDFPAATIACPLFSCLFSPTSICSPLRWAFRFPPSRHRGLAIPSSPYIRWLGCNGRGRSFLVSTSPAKQAYQEVHQPSHNPDRSVARNFTTSTSLTLSSSDASDSTATATLTSGLPGATSNPNILPAERQQDPKATSLPPQALPHPQAQHSNDASAPVTGDLSGQLTRTAVLTTPGAQSSSSSSAATRQHSSTKTLRRLGGKDVRRRCSVGGACVVRL